LVFVALFLFNDYLYVNITTLGNDSLGRIFIVTLSLLIGLIIWRIIISKNIYVRKSLIVLIFFFLYLISKICIDIGDLDKLKGYTIGSRGGIILFYLIGMLINITIDKVNTLTEYSGRRFLLSVVLSGMYIFSNGYFIFMAFSELSENLRKTVFLISEPGVYQGPGNFLTISSLLLSFIYIRLLLNAHKHNYLYKFLFFVYGCAIIVILLSSMLLAQMIGSNNAFICTGFLLGINFIFSIFLLFSKVKDILESRFINLKNIVSGVIFRKLVISVLIGITGTVIFLIFAVNLLDIDINKLRITGYGSGEVSSISSREVLLSNFSVHLFYSPITPFVGNMQVDALTTGAGTYVHSFLVSILTHLGIMGIILILLFMFFAIKELFDKNSGIYKNGMKIYKILLFLFFLLIATAATFFTWIPIWFLFGLFFIPISLNINNKKLIE